MKTFITILITAAIAVTGTWFYKSHLKTDAGQATVSQERLPDHYQCAMHPWIKSDKPGRCTICGMELTPIFAGEKGFDSTGGDSIIPLTQNQIQVMNVQTAVAKTQPFTKTLKVAGTIDDDATRHRILSAYVDGRVEKLHVNFMGAEVREGQPLAEFYSPNLLQTEREYRQLSGDLKKNTGLRLRQMGLTSEQIADVDQKPAEVLTSQILAPIGGTVVEQTVYEGQYVTAGEKLFAIADFSTMWFMFPAYEQDMPWISLGQSVSITTPSKPGKTFVGKVAFIDPNFDETTRSTKIRVELANPLVDGKRELLHRLYADGAVEVKTPAVLTVPRAAVIQTGAQAVVYVDQSGGAYSQMPVKIGRHGDDQVEILSGISEGDRVVINGNLLLDGQAELNRSFMTSPAPAAPVTVAALTEQQKKLIGEFIKIADSMAGALATDDLAAFNQASEPVMMKTAELADSLGQREGIQKLKDARHFHGFDDLAKARDAFYKFSMAATRVLQPMRATAGFPEFQLWECPMTDQAIPGAAKKGRWIQVGGRPGGNPFFGVAMPDCGKEIQ
ncbi:MAG: efflux RND transporter periplasmic adaptor subunit [Luteolibacter sp.]